jgi:hypothetical protein
VGGILDGGGPIQHAEDPLGRRHGPLEEVVLLRKVLDGAEEAPGVLEEGGHHPHRGAPNQDRDPAVPEDQGQRHRREELDDGEEEGVVGDGAEVGGQIVLVDGVQGPGIRFLPIEELDHPHPGDPLVEEGVDPGQAHPDIPIGIPDPLPEQRHGDPHQREHCEAHQGQFPVHPSIAPRMKTRVKTSPNTETNPEEKSSFSVSTSDVRRVMSRPTGLRS